MYPHMYVLLILTVFSLLLVLATHFVRPINGPRIAIALALALIPWLVHSGLASLIVAAVFVVIAISLFFAMST